MSRLWKRSYDKARTEEATKKQQAKTSQAMESLAIFTSLQGKGFCYGQKWSFLTLLDAGKSAQERKRMSTWGTRKGLQKGTKHPSMKNKLQTTS